MALLVALWCFAAGTAPVQASPLVPTAESPAETEAEAAAEAKVPLDEKALWLPVKYQGYYIKLVTAAQAALNQPRCIEVKQATLDLRQTTPERPLFRILCRQASGKTYTEMIEGNNYTSLTPKKSSAMACRQLLIAKTQQMVGLTWLHKKGESLTSSQAGVERYQWDFDAVSVDGVPLHYRAICESRLGQPRLQISPRR
ncbi:MAG TPA: hypothetical protein VIC26_12175 [Marinagarivorans sp.]